MYDIFPDPQEGPGINDNSELDKKNGNNVDKKKLDIKKESVGHLPDELLKFVNNDSYSLLVKGNPGTGKTIFALTLMDNLDHNSNYFYISTRLSIKQLSHFYPWISKFTIQPESKYEYKFEDARLDEPESLFERITNQLMDVKSPIIIIDTWDAIASFMDRESRLNNERVLQIWRERAGAKLIFLSESYDTSLLDSIVDGVITLKLAFKNSNY
jgi:KaiC/GvpD/RAD55 family RecA-like ATPase